MYNPPRTSELSRDTGAVESHNFLNTSLKDRAGGGCVSRHCGNEDAVFMVFVEALPGSSEPRIRGGPDF